MSHAPVIPFTVKSSLESVKYHPLVEDVRGGGLASNSTFPILKALLDDPDATVKAVVLRPLYLRNIAHGVTSACVCAVV